MHVSDRFSSFPQRRRGVIVRRLDNEAVVYDPAHHSMCYLNQTALWVWDRSDGKTPIAKMAPPHDGLEKEASRDEVIERNIDQAVDTLIERGLLDIVLEPPPQCS